MRFAILFSLAALSAIGCTPPPAQAPVDSVGTVAQLTAGVEKDPAAATTENADATANKAVPTGVSYETGYLTIFNYEKIEEGMTEDQVLALLGRKYAVRSQGNPGITFWAWNKKGIPMARAEFKNGKLFYKTYYGLTGVPYNGPHNP